MSELLDLALRAHGGRERWRRAGTIRARLHMTGATLTALGHPKTLDGVDLEVDVHRQRTIISGFTGPGRRGVYTPDHVRLEDPDGTVLEERGAPREAFPARLAGTRWDALNVLYFAGYGLWNYLTTPYLFTWPGVRTEELEPGENLRRLRVRFPGDLATHSAEQVFSFDHQGLLRRVEYAPEVLGDRPAVHHTWAHQEVSGLVVPTHRYVLPAGDSRAEPLFVLDLSGLSVEGGR